ncbi:MAG: ribosome biogenesis GTPase Der [Dehalococcoidia bacterium]|nr:ribosome biogenesis GTPase Der [Dehalococcoidia bacterium]
MRRPIVALVGRPNVGKSTLFNRLVGARVAIVADAPGTTRDRVNAETSWADRRFALVDTGGIEAEPSSGLRVQVREQAETAIREADVVVFLVDARDGLTSEDLTVADILRKSKKPVILVANKADNETRRQNTVEFYALGLGEPLSISAYHNIGVSDLMDQVVERLPPAPPEEPDSEVMKLAIVGRPNVGKSMLLNAILGEERSIVSETPGTTRDVIDTTFTFQGEPLVLLDTAGIRRSGSVESGVERASVLRAMRAIERADVTLLVLDASELGTAQDAHVAGYVLEAYKGLVLTVNKWDLAEKLGLDEEKAVAIVRHRFRFIPWAPVVFVSALAGTGIEKALTQAREVYQERTRRVSTALLNTLMMRAGSRQAPPMVKGRRLHIYYLTQPAVNPPTFVFFVNDPDLLHFSYQRFLENVIREAFGFAGTPIRLVFRARSESSS